MSHKPQRRSSCHVLSEANMASSNHSNNDPASIQSIASTAISHIQQLVSLVEQRPTAASTSSNKLQVATPQAGTALEELRRRFPTVSARSSRNAATGRYTCQLFLRYKREIFILGVLGFLKTTRSFPKILPKTSEVCQRRARSQCFSLQKSEIARKVLPFIHFTHGFRSLHGSE